MVNCAVVSRRQLRPERDAQALESGKALSRSCAELAKAFRQDDARWHLWHYLARSCEDVVWILMPTGAFLIVWWLDSITSSWRIFVCQSDVK